MTNETMLLTALTNGIPITEFQPQNNKQAYLAYLNGLEIELPEPRTMEEALLYNYCVNGGGNSGGGSGGGGASVSPKDVNFYDYDGTVLYAYTVEEAQALTEMPALPEREGLICQGWNWSLEDIKAHNRAVDVGAMYITDDGKTRIYITLQEGRTSPMLGVCPNGTVTVDWGDGTEPDVLTGTSTNYVRFENIIWTPNHEYASAGDYVIALTVEGEMAFAGGNGYNASSSSCVLRYSSSGDLRNHNYLTAVQKVEIGNGVNYIGDCAFDGCHALTSVTIPNSVKGLGTYYAFQECYALTSVTIPNSVTEICSDAFRNCYALTSVAIPNSVTTIKGNAFEGCRALTSVAIPNSVTYMQSSAFSTGYNIRRVALPNNITSLESILSNAQNLTSITIPSSVTTINGTFYYCYALTSVAIPNSVTTIKGSAFYRCGGVRYYDFSNHAKVPTLSSSGAFYGIPSDCEIRVPAALYDEWIAATNWSTYASQIVAV